MSFKRGGGTKPSHYIAVTAKVGKGRYEKGPYIGLWEGDGEDGPLFRGSTSGKYLDELYDFIKEYGEDTVSFAVFESRGDKKSRRRSRDEDDEDDNGRRSSRGKRDRDRDEDDDDDKGRSSKRKSRDDDEDDDKGRSSKRKGRDKDEDRGGKRGKKDAWWDD